VSWDELPGWSEDSLHEAWNAWLKNCERPGPVFGPLCADVRRLSIADADEQRLWMVSRLQPYRVEPLQGASEGLLTSYYEPIMNASRQAAPGFGVPLYAYPQAAQQAQRQGAPWFTRQQLDTLPEARAALAGQEIAWLADPIDALILQIQGSGRIRVLQPDGSSRTTRLAFAGTNEQPYKSVGKWLLDQGLVKDASWPGIKAWLAQNPQRQQELLWSNPRMVFFREEALNDPDADYGPRGAQGVALTAGRSIAVDPGSMPYGTPVWIASNGPQTQLQKLVMAQDTGSAITGAVRADYFAGSGAQAGELAGRLKQPLQMWVLWPR
jgi:membrane-bound lytic murein transglycosylase A